ncbi:patatin-like phospholipase family protein [Nocardiopsis sp. HUAS JQ3]|uniref:patatin-like phospholipase family protein n=1 Tax=Nocardiopsis sp. HUAS JQ3 TaxID=3061629 RepID=UPI0023A9BFAB|nr:patatin-like phospholipase family protein [Nocardiopsis sp. HUAS JQ3]WDZ93734.1 patatin-like phospholipase family protein [Nocardiopsis sp. HUAS JQ3]
MNTGLILGGGGWVGIAWETGVLAALGEHAGFTPSACSVAVGTSAGAYVAAMAMGGVDLAERVRAEQSGALLTPLAPLPEPTRDTTTDTGGGTSAVPPEIMRLMLSPEGPSTGRARAVGRLAMAATRDRDQDAAVHTLRSVLPLSAWPEGDLRITSVRCETGETVSWTRSDGIDLATAVASSCAVPGFFPPVRFDGAHYCDAPRLPGAAALAEEKDLDAIVFIGPRAGALANVAEDAELDELERQGLRIVRITDGPDFTEVSGELLDPRLRPRAARIGLDDGRRAAEQVASLL